MKNKICFIGIGALFGIGVIFGSIGAAICDLTLVRIAITAPLFSVPLMLMTD